MKPIETEIINLLTQELQPEVLEVENESDMHQGPPGRESHFKVYVVSSQFQGQSRIARQRTVFAILASVMTKVHALSLRACTREEHDKSTAQFTTPQCASKK